MAKKNVVGDLEVTPAFELKGKSRKHIPIVRIEETDSDSGWWGTFLNEKEVNKLIALLTKTLEEAKKEAAVRG